MTFAQRRNHLTTYFSECIHVVKRRMTLERHVDRVGERKNERENQCLIYFSAMYVYLLQTQRHKLLVPYIARLLFCSHRHDSVQPETHLHCHIDLLHAQLATAWQLKLSEPSFYNPLEWIQFMEPHKYTESLFMECIELMFQFPLFYRVNVNTKMGKSKERQ